MPITAAEKLLFDIFSKQLELPGNPISTEMLCKGDQFHELKDTPKMKMGKVLETPEPCKTEPANIHLKTSRGNWCIPRCQTVLVA